MAGIRDPLVEEFLTPPERFTRRVGIDESVDPSRHVGGCVIVPGNEAKAPLTATIHRGGLPVPSGDAHAPVPDEH